MNKRGIGMGKHANCGDDGGGKVESLLKLMKLEENIFDKIYSINIFYSKI
jgi:hypothetical protein